MTAWWVALGFWYVGLAYVGVWNHQSRPIWRRLDAYPLRLRVNLFNPFGRRWRRIFPMDELGWVTDFRRAVLRRVTLVVVPPVVIFGWLYGVTWMQYSDSLERRARYEIQIEKHIARQRARDWPPILKEAMMGSGPSPECTP